MNTNTDGLRVLHQHLQNTTSNRPGHAKAEQPGPERCMSPEFGDDIFKIIEQAMQEKERLAHQKENQEHQQAQQDSYRHQMTSPTAALSPQKEALEEKMYRVFDCNAINAPGAMYKAVTCTVDTTAHELIQATLDRFGSSEDPSLFELRYAVEPDPSRKKKTAEPPRVLKDADCPVMVAEWFTDMLVTGPERKEEETDSKNPPPSVHLWSSSIPENTRCTLELFMLTLA